MHRRTVLALIGTGSLILVAGCADNEEPDEEEGDEAEDETDEEEEDDDDIGY